MPSAKFNKVYSDMGAFKDRSDKTGNPTNDEQLDLYALAKIAKGEDINAQPKPGMFDMTGKAKRNAWQKWVDKGTSASQAESEYVKHAEGLIKKYTK